MGRSPIKMRNVGSNLLLVENVRCRAVRYLADNPTVRDRPRLSEPVKSDDVAATALAPADHAVAGKTFETTALEGE
jgi:hypothetical protein